MMGKQIAHRWSGLLKIYTQLGMQKQSIINLYIDFVAQELAEIRICVQKSAIGPLRGLQ